MTNQKEALRLSALYGAINAEDAVRIGGLGGDLYSNGRSPHQAVLSLRASKPHLFRDIRELSEAERANIIREVSKLAEHGNQKPLDVSKSAKDLTPAERARWMAEAERRDRRR